MAYAQKNYLALQGINGKYRIDQIGCFLTAFCNLEADFAADVSPVSLNDYFIGHGTYVDVDDGVRDDLGWGSISAFDNSTVVAHIGGAGWPTSNQSIVKFIYRSKQTGQMTTHFCKVADAGQHLIVDSWDGVVKASPYGEPVAFAEYGRSKPQPVTPPVPVKPYSIEEIPAKEVILNKDINKWGMNYDNFAAIEANPEGHGTAGLVLTARAICHHSIGENYYLEDPSVPSGWNVKDCDDLPAPADAPAPVVETPAPSEEEAPKPAPDAPADIIEKVNKADYRAKDAMEVHDLTTGALLSDIDEGMIVHAVTRYTVGAKTYVRTQKAKDGGVYYDIDMAKLELVKTYNIEDDDDSIFDDLKLDDVVSSIAKVSGKIVDEAEAKLRNNKNLREKLVNWLSVHVFRANKNKK